VTGQDRGDMGMRLSADETQSARRLAAAAGGELEIWDVAADPAMADLGEEAARLYGMPPQDALIALDRDLMIKDGWPRCGAEQIALRHGRKRALDEFQADREAGG
jgi:hypothetical protein